VMEEEQCYFRKSYYDSESSEFLLNEFHNNTAARKNTFVSHPRTIVPSYKYLGFGIVELILLLGAFFAFVNYDDSGPSDCLSKDGKSDLCYCEAFSGGKIKEPINTGSALAFSSVGIVILICMGRQQPPSINRMTGDPFYPFVYGLLAVFLGPGSMLFHSKLSSVGGFFDTFSMYLWLSFIVVYDIVRLTNLSKVLAAILYVLLVTVLASIEQMRGGDLVFATLVFIALFTELLVFFAHKCKMDWQAYKWFFYGLGLFLVAFVIWKLSRTGGPLCFPNTYLQGHAVWHSLCSLTVAFVYKYLQLTQDPPIILCKC